MDSEEAESVADKILEQEAMRKNLEPRNAVYGSGCPDHLDSGPVGRGHE